MNDDFEWIMRIYGTLLMETYYCGIIGPIQ